MRPSRSSRFPAGGTLAVATDTVDDAAAENVTAAEPASRRRGRTLDG